MKKKKLSDRERIELAWSKVPPKELRRINQIVRQCTLKPLATPALKNEQPRRWQHVLGNCYQRAATVAMANEGTILVHGLLHPEIGVLRGRPYPHAWVLLPEDRLYDPTLRKVYDRAAYYTAFDAEEHLRVRHEDVRVALLEHDHWGPWKEKEG